MLVLSVIIINYNTFSLTCKCIESLIQYTQELSYEIILIDNNSTECNPDLFKQKFPKIHLIKNEVNLGFAKGNNLGLQQAKGDAILLLNSDTELKENSLKIAINKLNSYPKTGILSCRLIYPDGRIQSCCQRFPSVQLELIELLRLQKLLPVKQREKLLLGSFFDHRTEAEVDWVWGTFFMFRKEILKELPEQKLSDNFFMYGEDRQWCYEIKKQTGLAVTYFPKTAIIHHLSASTLKTSLNKQRLMIKHEYEFIKNNKGTLNAWLIFKLRALKYLTLGNRDFFSLYWDFNDQR
jgi:GT2 family glycosyltransferase